MSHSVWMRGMAASVGRLCPVSELLAEGESSETVELLAEKGIETFSRLEVPLLELVASHVGETLRLAGLAAEDIDGVLFVTESFSECVARPVARGETPLWAARGSLFDLLTELGVRAPVFCSTFGGSSNFLQAIFLGRPLIELGRFGNLLVVCIDSLMGGVSRFMYEAVAVTGDGVATCVLSNEPGASPAYLIEHVGITHIRQDPSASVATRMVEMYRAAKSAAADCYDAMSRQPDEFSWLLLSTYNHLTSQVFAKLLGFALERSWLHNVARTGHVPACDPLLNLVDLTRAALVEPDAGVMMFITGPISCGTVGLRARP